MVWDTLVGKGIGNTLTSSWQGPFWVTGLAGDHGKSYTLAQISGKKIKGLLHGDHVRKFCLREGYLIPASESRIPEYQNLRAPKQRKRRPIVTYLAPDQLTPTSSLPPT